MEGKYAGKFKSMDTKHKESVLTGTNILVGIIKQHLESDHILCLNRKERSVTLIITLPENFYTELGTSAVEEIHDRTIETMTAETEEWQKCEFTLLGLEVVVTLWLKEPSR